MITVKRSNANDPYFQSLVELLDLELQSRYGEAQVFYSQFNTLATIPYVVIAFAKDKAIGCGALRKFDEESAEIKRMFVDPAYRGKGVGWQIIAELEKWGKALGFSALILETGDRQPEAIRLYQKAGFTIFPNFGQYQNDDNSICMRKFLNTWPLNDV